MGFGRHVVADLARFDGAVWKAIRFIYRDKRVLLRDLRELGAVEAVETCIALRSMADDLREARKAADASRTARESRSEALAA